MDAVGLPALANKENQVSCEPLHNIACTTVDVKPNGHF
jgi:hypothetical protein